MAGFSTFDMLNKATKSNLEDKPKGRFKSKDININNIYSNDANFYPQDGIEEKAEEILALGLLENLVVIYEPCDKGEYTLISGERRWRALKLLVEKGNKEFEVATCNIRATSNKYEEKIEIILANSARVKNDALILQEEKELKETLEYMKKNKMELRGYDLQSGRLRDIIAKILNRSTSKIAQIEAINNKLIPELKEEVAKGNIGFSAAYELSRKEEDEQKEIYEKSKEAGTDITYTEVKEEKKAESEKENVLDSNTNGIEEIEEVEEINETTETIEAAEETTEFEPVPEKITSICYGCQNWNECNEKSNTVTSCNEYINKAEAEKTNEQRYEEEQAKLDKECERKLREQADEEKMNHLPSDEQTKVNQEKVLYRYRVASTVYAEISSGERTFDIRKNTHAYKKGAVMEMLEFKNGEHTGNTLRAVITYVMEEAAGLEEGYCIIGFKTLKESEENE